MFAAATKMKGGITPEEVRDMRAAWQRVFTVNMGELSAGLLLEYVLFIASVTLCWLAYISSRIRSSAGLST